MIKKIAGALGTTLGVKVAAGALGGLMLVGGTWHWMSVKQAKEDARIEGKVDGIKEAERLNKAIWEAERKKLEEERTAVVDERLAASEALRAAQATSETIRRDLRGGLEKLRADLGRQRATISNTPTPVSDLSSAITILSDELAREGGNSGPSIGASR